MGSEVGGSAVVGSAGGSVVGGSVVGALVVGGALVGGALVGGALVGGGWVETQLILVVDVLPAKLLGELTVRAAPSEPLRGCDTVWFSVRVRREEPERVSVPLATVPFDRRTAYWTIAGVRVTAIRIEMCTGIRWQLAVGLPAESETLAEATFAPKAERDWVLGPTVASDRETELG